MGSTLNSGESEFHWYGMMKICGKEKMSKKQDIGAMLGKADAIRSTITQRLRTLTGRIVTDEKGWEFGEWLANKAPDEILFSLIVIAHTRWQKDIIKKQNEERMAKLEWTSIYSLCPWNHASPDFFDIHTPGWRLPTVEETMWKIRHEDLSVIPNGLYWTSEEHAGVFAYRVEIPSMMTNYASKKAVGYVRFVREKKSSHDRDQLL